MAGPAVDNAPVKVGRVQQTNRRLAKWIGPLTTTPDYPTRRTTRRTGRTPRYLSGNHGGPIWLFFAEPVSWGLRSPRQVVMHFTSGVAVEGGGNDEDAEGRSMTGETMSPFGRRHSTQISPWTSLTSNRSYLFAALRAAAISLVLLAVLAILVLF